MKKIALTFLVLLLLVAGIAAGVFLIRRQTEFREKAAPSTTLTLVPSKTNPNVDETFTVQANINTGTNQISGVEFHLTFDETKVEALGVTNSTFFVTPKTIGPSLDNNNGTATYTVYIDPGTSGRQGQGTVAVFTFKAKAAGNTTIALSSDTNVPGNEGADTSTASDDNLLTGSTPAVLTIQGSNQPTATPTTAPTSGGATSTPTRTPTPTATGGVSAATNTPTSAVTSTSSGFTSTPTPIQQLPDSGISIPTVFGLGLGVFVLIGAVFLAL